MSAPPTEQLTSALLYDAGGRRYAMDPRIRGLKPGDRVEGPAFTVRCAKGDNLAIHRALQAAEPGDVLVIATSGGTESSYCGSLISLAAMVRGLAGIVLDGLVRDRDEIAGLDVPVFCRGSAHVGAVKNDPGELQIPVACGGVIVAPGDLVLGDGDGVVVVPAGERADILSRARDAAEREGHRRRSVRAGMFTLEVLATETETKDGESRHA
jgi:4-hydroxy-4-methyl-2-oxoglutarate aldolase